MTEAARYVAQVLPALLDLLRDSDIYEIELREGDVQVRLHRTADMPEQVIDEMAGEEEVVAPTAPPIAEITAPLVGTFYRADKPGMPPLVEEGSRVEEDTVVGIVEALSELTEIEAGCRGVISEVCATDGQIVEYGEVLFGVSLGD